MDENERNNSYSLAFEIGFDFYKYFGRAEVYWSSNSYYQHLILNSMKDHLTPILNNFRDFLELEHSIKDEPPLAESFSGFRDLLLVSLNSESRLEAAKFFDGLIDYHNEEYHPEDGLNDERGKEWEEARKKIFTGPDWDNLKKGFEELHSAVRKKFTSNNSAVFFSLGFNLQRPEFPIENKKIGIEPSGLEGEVSDVDAELGMISLLKTAKKLHPGLDQIDFESTRIFSEPTELKKTILKALRRPEPEYEENHLGLRLYRRTKCVGRKGSNIKFSLENTSVLWALLVVLADNAKDDWISTEDLEESVPSRLPDKSNGGDGSNSPGGRLRTLIYRLNGKSQPKYLSSIGLRIANNRKRAYRLESVNK